MSGRTAKLKHLYRHYREQKNEGTDLWLVYRIMGVKVNRCL